MLGKLPSYKKANLQLIAYRRIQHALAAMLRRFRLSTTQWIMLGIICDTDGGVRVTDMAKALQVEMPLITTTAQTLIAKGLVRSTRHERDKRSKVLTLTAEGESQVAEVESYLERNISRLEEGVSKNELSAYFHMLQKLSSNASSISRAT